MTFYHPEEDVAIKSGGIQGGDQKESGKTSKGCAGEGYILINKIKVMGSFSLCFFFHHFTG